MPVIRSVLPDDHPVSTWHELCLALGGDVTSFTGDLLHLIAKADPGNRARLRAGFPQHVAAWEMWTEADPPMTAGELAANIAHVPDKLPPEIMAQVEEGRAHPERRVPYRRRDATSGSTSAQG